MNNKHHKCSCRPQVIQNKIFINFEPHIKKTCLICILIVILFLGNMKVNFAAILDFFHLNLLVSNFYFWSTKLLQINHIIVNIVSGILIVTGNI